MRPGLAAVRRACTVRRPGRANRHPARRRHRPRDHCAAALELLDRRRRLRVRRAPDRRRVDRCPRHRPHRRGARRLPRLRRRAAGRRRGPEVGRRVAADPAAPRPEQGLLGLRKGLGLFANLRPVRPEPGAARRQPAQARPDRGHRPARGARADRRHLLRRLRPRRRHAPTTTAPTASARSSGSPASAFAARAHRRSRASTRPTCWRRRGSGARR